MSTLLRTCFAVIAGTGLSCSTVPDLGRSPPERGTLGTVLYGALCDRVGAQTLREDVTGASYQRLCHPDGAGGQDSLRVDRTALPPLGRNTHDGSGRVVPLASQQTSRERSIARVEAVAAERDPLVAAFDAMLPDVALAPPGCPSAKDTVPLRRAVLTALSGLVPLYEDGTVPDVTRALGGLFREAESDGPLRRALARLDARRGYRPAELALYVLEPVLSYPRLFELGGALAAGHREDRHGARRAMAHLLRAAGSELQPAPEPPPSIEPPLEVTEDPLAGLARLSRPRTVAELSVELLTARAHEQAGSSMSVVRRDPRGLAQVVWRGGTLPWPFIEDPTGQPAVDDLGRFVTRDDRPPPAPFAATGARDPLRDGLGRALSEWGDPLYAYIDVSGSVMGDLAKRLAPLVRPREDGGDEALFDLRWAANAMLGPRAPQPDGSVRLRAAAAPAVDLAHALGAAMARPELDDALRLFSKLARDRPELIARWVRLGLSLDAIADAYPDVRLRPSSTLWDELLDVMIEVAKTGTLLEDLLTALADERTEKLGPVFASYMRYRDELTYFRDFENPEKRESLNGRVWNATSADFSDMHTPVDRRRPDSGKNRSVLQRFLQLLHDANGLSACSKDGAVAHVNITWPPGGKGVPVRLDYPNHPLAKTVCAFLGKKAPKRIPECGILRLDNVAELLIAVALGEAELDVRDECLKALVDSPLAGLVGGANTFLEETSGIDGFSMDPTPQGVARLAFFDAPYAAWGGYAGDVFYPKTSRFLADVIDPVPTMVCPARAYVDPIDGKALMMRRCERFEDTLRGRDANGLFPLEQLDFVELVQPLARAFAKNGANGTFVRLLDVLHRHWGSDRQTRVECDPTLKPDDARYCTQDGVVAYEPMLAEMLDQGGLLRELRQVMTVLADTAVTHCASADGPCRDDGTRNGIQVVSEAVRGLLDPARSTGLTDVRGRRASRRNDGTFNPQTTPVGLALDALARVDALWAAKPAEQRSWLVARSSIVDTLLAVTGGDAEPRFALRAIDAALPRAVDLLHSQLLAHCPRGSARCTWTEELAPRLGHWLEKPVVANFLETLDALLADTDARRELGRFLSHLMRDGGNEQILAAVVDLLQVLDDVEGMGPVSRLLGRALSLGEGRPPALVPALIALVEKVFDDVGGAGCTSVDPHRALAAMLSRAVRPLESGQKAPLQALLDAAYHVNRLDPRATGSFAPEDVAQLSKEFGDLLLDEASGLEQVYAVLRQATPDAR